jgi:hypothetical protein
MWKHTHRGLVFKYLSRFCNTLSAKKNGTKQTHLNVGQISAALKSLEKHDENKIEKKIE